MSTTTDWKSILNINITDTYGLQVNVGIILGIALVASLIVIFILRKFTLGGNFFDTDVELNVNLGGIGSVKIKSNNEVAQIAHSAWTEFITRKAGLPFDQDHDVIVEVYNSWKELFERIRSLIKDIPANRIKHQNTQKLINLLVDTLNKGLRPHLTKWQARYRSWYECEIKKPENAGKSPQEIQMMYPEYRELTTDLTIINQQIISYTTELKKLTE